MNKFKMGVAAATVACMTLLIGMNVLAAECEETGVHTAGAEPVIEADYTECNGGYKEDVYECIYCETYVRHDGSDIEYFEGTNVHIPSGEVYKADFTECGGGFKEDHYLCSECGNPTTAEGKFAMLYSATVAHTPGQEKHLANYTECEGGFKEDFYLCTVCKWGCGPEGENYLFYPGNGHKLIKIPAKAATTQEAGNLEYWLCEVCENAYADAKGKEYIEDVNEYIIPILKDEDSSKEDVSDEDNETDSETELKTKAPATGDATSNLMMQLLVSMMILSIAVMAGILTMNK